MVKKITRLDMRDRATLDRDCLTPLYAELGQQGAEGVVCRALEELAARVARAHQHMLDGEHAALMKTAKSNVSIAEQIGLLELSTACLAVVDAARGGDGVAIVATVTRMQRVAEASLSAVWELQDVSF